MKFVVSSSLLSSRLQAAGRVIIAKNTLHILDCFLFDIKGNVLSVTASDNETVVTTTIDLVESDSDIRLAVNAKTIQDAIKEIPEQPLDFYVNESTLEVTVDYQNGQYNFMAQAADDYPMLEKKEEEKGTLCLSATRLMSALPRALFAASDETMRPVMNGVYFDIHDNSTVLVGSDGHKLAMTSLSDVTGSEESSFILPKKAGTLIKNILSREEGEVVVHIYDRYVLFETEGFKISCLQVEGRFPKYTSVIPQNNPNVVTVNRQAMLAALRRVLIFPTTNNSLVRLRIEGNRIVISSQDIDFSMSAEESLMCEYDGNPLSIGFKGTFLVDMMNNIDSEEICLKLGDPGRAGVITPATQNETERVLMLLMPMMLPS
jgi:DNA polymerase-3 subunit beta